ncbi:oligosaccharide flippase family protein [Patescibacteria group bacterium]
MGLLKKITINTLTQILGRSGVILISLVVTAILTRHLGENGYGIFGVISGATMMFFSFADWGTILIAVRELANKKGKEALILGNSLIIRATMSLVAIFLFIVFVYVNPAFDKFKIEILIAGVIIFFLSIKTSAQIIFHAEMKLYFSALVELVGSLFFLLALILGSGNLSLRRAIIFLVFSSVVSAAFALGIVLKRVRPVFRLEKNFSRTLLKASLPMGAVLAVYSIYTRLGSFVLQFIHGEVAVGIYLLAFKVHDNLKLGAAYLMNAFFPVIASLPNSKNNEPNSKLGPVVQKAFDALLVMAIVILGGTFLLAPMIIGVLAGPSFSSSVRVLRILGLVTALSYLNHLTGYSLVALKEQKKHLLFGMIGLTFNLLGSLLVIPRWSYVGLAWVAVVTEGLIFCLSFYFLNRKIRVRFSLSSVLETFSFLLKKVRKIL